MKKYLVMGGMEPDERYSASDNLKYNLIAKNSGNMVFAYGIMNILETEDTHCVSTHYKRNWSDEEIDEINQTYEAFILPFADAFREDYVKPLIKYTEFVRRLKIPCIVTGIGLRAPFEPEINKERACDEAVAGFVKAVLEKSSVVGLRGSITGDYLKRLGFAPEKDYTVIGCPSLYMHGTGIPHKELPDEINNYVSNMNVKFPGSISSEFLVNSFKSYKNAYLVQQRQVEFMDMYYGRRDKDENVTVLDSRDFEALKKKNRVKFFIDVPKWLEFMSGMDLFVGNRFHGSVSAVLSGVPSVLIPFDARTRELAEYHNLTHIFEYELSTGKTIKDYLDKLDFTGFSASLKSRLEHYKDFLRANGLPNILEKEDSHPFGSSYAEKVLLKKSAGDCSCYLAAGGGEKLRRNMEYYRIKASKKAFGNK